MGRNERNSPRNKCESSFLGFLICHINFSATFPRQGYHWQRYGIFEDELLLVSEQPTLDQIVIKCLVKPSTFNNEFDYLSAKWRMISENPFKCSRSLRGIFRCTGCTGQPSRNPGDGPTALLSNAFYCLESPSCLVPTKEINRIRWRVIVEFFLVFWNDCWFGQDFMHVSLPPIQNAGPSWG